MTFVEPTLENNNPSMTYAGIYSNINSAYDLKLVFVLPKYVDVVPLPQ